MSWTTSSGWESIATWLVAASTVVAPIRAANWRSMRPAAQEITREDLTMAHFGPLLERNRHFATTNAREGASILARHPVYVITCLDPRTDPSAFLELGLGDAIVVRNAGGRAHARRRHGDARMSTQGRGRQPGRTPDV